ncbi:ankyrin [Hypoxylon sp. FL0890]|nr:ankyrin [Hypoxylon sp. FL0890]
MATMSDIASSSPSSTYSGAGISSNGTNNHYPISREPSDNSQVNYRAFDDVTGPSNHVVPIELILHIGQYLPQCDKGNLGQTCRKLYDIMTPLMYKEDSLQDHHALWWACFANCDSLLKKLLAITPHLANYRFQARHRGLHTIGFNPSLSLGVTPLVVSIYYGSYLVLRVLLRSGADVNLADIDPVSSSGRLFHGHSLRWYPINWAIKLLHLRDFAHCLGLLVKRGANIDQFPELAMPVGAIAPSWNPSSGDTTALFQMLRVKPVVEQRDISHREYQDQLNLNYSKLKILLKLGADAKATEPLTSHTPIFRIASGLKKFQPWPSYGGGHILLRHEVNFLYENHLVPHAERMIRKLIEAGSNPSIMCWEDAAVQSPLHLLCNNSNRYEKLIYVLLEAGVDINKADTNGQTPIYRLMDHPPADVRILNRFITNGARLDVRDNVLDTPLHALCREYGACQTTLQRTIKVLLRRGADPMAEEIRGLTPRDLLKTRVAPVWQSTLNILDAAETRVMRGRLGGGARFGGARRVRS